MHRVGFSGVAFNPKLRDLFVACDLSGRVHIWRLGVYVLTLMGSIAMYICLYIYFLYSEEFVVMCVVVIWFCMCGKVYTCVNIWWLCVYVCTSVCMY